MHRLAGQARQPATPAPCPRSTDIDHPPRSRSLGFTTPGLTAWQRRSTVRALLTRTGDGHTSIYTSECARSAAEAFLVETQTEANRVCDG